MATKHKKKEKQKDFVKKKLKVGKSKPNATSHTDTSFKAKTITLPNQSIVGEGKSITDYLQLLTHTSYKTRKQTLLYIKENFVEKALAGSQSVDYKPIILKSAARLTDEDKSVRNTVVELFSAMPPAALDANASNIMLFARSAMTHIKPEIRATSTAVIDLLIEKAPQQVCRANFASTMKCFVSLLGWQDLLTSMEAAKAKGTFKNGKMSTAGANSIIASSSLELVGSMTKARASHVKSLGLLIQAGMLPDYGQKEEEEDMVDAMEEDANGNGKKPSNSTEQSEETVEDYQPLSEAEATHQVNTLLENSFTPRHIAAAIKQRKANEVAYKFLIPNTSMPFLSLNLFGASLNNNQSGMASSSMLTTAATKNKKSKAKAKNAMFNYEVPKGLGLGNASSSATQYHPSTVTVTEDIESRLQLVDYYKPIILEGLEVMIKEGGELGRATKKTLEIVEAVDYKGNS